MNTQGRGGSTPRNQLIGNSHIIYYVYIINLLRIKTDVYNHKSPNYAYNLSVYETNIINMFNMKNMYDVEV